MQDPELHAELPAISAESPLDLREQAPSQPLLFPATASNHTALAAAMCSAVLSSSAQAIFSYSPDGKILSWNEAAEFIFGYTALELLGSDHADLIPLALRSDAEGVHARVVSGETVRGFETYYRHKSGNELQVALNLAPVLSQGQLVAVCVTATDLSRQRAAELKRQGYLAEIEKKTAEIEQFVYTVSHDLKTPLVTIQSFLGFLEEDLSGQDWEGAKDAIARIRSASKRMRELIDDILTISRLGKQKLHCDKVDVGDIVQDLLEELAAEKHAEDVITVNEGLPEVIADPVHLKQVFTNLLKNCLRHGRKGEQAAKVEIGYTAAGDEHRFYVRDDGPGIAVEHHRRIFHLFQKLTAPGSHGTGAGLAVVEKLVELHGGRAWVDSEPPQGATFWFAIPANLPLAPLA